MPVEQFKEYQTFRKEVIDPNELIYKELCKRSIEVHTWVEETEKFIQECWESLPCSMDELIATMESINEELSAENDRLLELFKENEIEIERHELLPKD